MYCLITQYDKSKHKLYIYKTKEQLESDVHYVKANTDLYSFFIAIM